MRKHFFYDNAIVANKKGILYDTTSVASNEAYAKFLAPVIKPFRSLHPDILIIHKFKH